MRDRWKPCGCSKRCERTWQGTTDHPVWVQLPSDTYCSMLEAEDREHIVCALRPDLAIECHEMKCRELAVGVVFFTIAEGKYGVPVCESHLGEIDTILLDPVIDPSES